MTNEQWKALKRVRLASLDYTVAVNAKAPWGELEDLERAQAAAVWTALQAGCAFDEVVAVEQAGAEVAA